MKKLGLITSTILFLSINFISAEGEFKEILASIDSSLVLLLSIFIISFAALFFSLNKFFKGNSTIPGVIALAASFLLTYGLSRTNINLDLGTLFSNIGISEAGKNVLLGLLVIAGIVLITTKFRINSLLILGLISITMGLFLPVHNEILFFIGGILIIIRMFFRKPKDGDGYE